jgi:bacterioferritin (cytochrome b1)
MENSIKSIDNLLAEQKESVVRLSNEISGDISSEITKSEIVLSQEVKSYSSDSVIELLKQSLNIHWQQTTSLTAQAEHLERWGYKKLATIIREDSREEQEHAAINISRLEFFDTDYQPLVVTPQVWKRHDMAAMIQYNLNSVQQAAAVEKATIVAARSVGDEITAKIMIPLLQGSEDGIRLYEGYMKLIEQMGIDNFLTLQV